jgi:hypothetical protein
MLKKILNTWNIPNKFQQSKNTFLCSSILKCSQTGTLYSQIRTENEPFFTRTHLSTHNVSVFLFSELGPSLALGTNRNAKGMLNRKNENVRN